MSGGIPLVVSEGTPYARGLHLGRVEAARVARSVRAYLALFRAVASLRRDEAFARAARFVPVIGDYAPHLLEEMRGLADGSGQEFHAIVALNCRTELLYGAGTATECTAIGVAPPASLDGHVRLAQNWDWHPALSGSLVLWAQRRDDGPDLVTLTEAGMVGKIGVNAAGLAIAVNLLTSDGDHAGPAIPMHVVLRRVLERAATVPEAIALIEAAPRCTSCNHLLADRDGTLASVEATPAAVRVVRTTDGVLTHANHCRHPDLREGDSYARDKPDTVARGERADALAAGRPLDEAAIRTLLADHATAPKGICRHAQPELPEAEQAESIASLIIDLTAGTLDLADGPPCVTPYRRLPLAAYLRTQVPANEGSAQHRDTETQRVL